MKDGEDNSVSTKRWYEYGLCIHGGGPWVLRKIELKQAFSFTFFHDTKKVLDFTHDENLSFLASFLSLN